MEQIQEEPLIFLRVSSLSHSEYCDKRSKIESFGGSTHYYSNNPKGPIAIGNRLHGQFSYMGMDFNSNLVLSMLEGFLIRRSFQKQIDNIVIRGMFDNLRVLVVDGKKYSVLLELKTITKKFLWNRELKAAIRQLQLYMWILKEILEYLGYPLWKRGYLEIYSQNTGYLLKRVSVEYDDNIEEWIREVVNKFKGLSRMNVPHYAYCKRCPSQVRDKCDWYFLRKKQHE